MSPRDRIKKYFQIHELVDEDVYNKWRESAWKFIDDKLIETLLVIREGLDKPMTINNWKWGGNFSQRGLRHNRSPLVIGKKGVYLSAHMLGKAADFDVKGMTAEEVREWIEENEDMFPHKVRLEHKLKGKIIGWCHIDVYDDPSNPKVYKFNV